MLVQGSHRLLITGCKVFSRLFQGQQQQFSRIHFKARPPLPPLLPTKFYCHMILTFYKTKLYRCRIWALTNSRTFQGFYSILAKFKDFQGLENEAIFFKDFQGCGNPVVGEASAHDTARHQNYHLFIHGIWVFNQRWKDGVLPGILSKTSLIKFCNSTWKTKDYFDQRLPRELINWRKLDTFNLTIFL